MAPQPTKEDKFSFGLWTVGWRARDFFGEETRPVLAAVVLSVLPILVLYIVGRRQLLRGLTAGFGK